MLPPFDPFLHSWTQFLAYAAQSPGLQVKRPDGLKSPPLDHDFANSEDLYFDADKGLYLAVMHESEKLWTYGMPNPTPAQLLTRAHRQQQDYLDLENVLYADIRTLGYHCPQTVFLTTEQPAIDFYTQSPVDKEDRDVFWTTYPVLKISQAIPGQTLRELKQDTTIDADLRTMRTEQGARQAVLLGTLIDDNDRTSGNVLYYNETYYHIDFEFAGKSDGDSPLIVNLSDYKNCDDIVVDTHQLALDFIRTKAEIAANPLIDKREKQLYQYRADDALVLLNEINSAAPLPKHVF